MSALVMRKVSGGFCDLGCKRNAQRVVEIAGYPLRRARSVFHDDRLRLCGHCAKAWQRTWAEVSPATAEADRG